VLERSWKSRRFYETQLHPLIPVKWVYSPIPKKTYILNKIVGADEDALARDLAKSRIIKEFHESHT
jgi:hypothetical protein